MDFSHYTETIKTPSPLPDLLSSDIIRSLTFLCVGERGYKYFEVKQFRSCAKCEYYIGYSYFSTTFAIGGKKGVVPLGVNPLGTTISA